MTTNTMTLIQPIAPVQTVELNKSMIDAWISYLDAKPATVQSYTNKIFCFYQWLQDNGITQPTRETIIAYRDELAIDHKPTTVNAYLAAVKQFFMWLSSIGAYLNIAANVKRMKVDEGFKHQNLTTDQCIELLDSVDLKSKAGLRDYAIILVMLTTGLRTIELSRANHEDLKVRGNSVVLYVQGKGKDDKTAYVKIPPKTEKALRAYINSKPASLRTGALFTSVSNRNLAQRISRDTIGKMIKDRLRSIGLDADDLTAHSLRHTSATINMLEGGTLEETKILMRHSQVTTTMIYSHAIDRETNCSEMRIEHAIFGK